jgi:hypothetical protein
MIVPEPCGYAVLLLIANIQKTVPCDRIKKMHTPVGVPPSSLLTSLRLLVRCLPLETTRRKREGRKCGIQAQLNHLWLSSSRWRHYRLLAICDLERHPISSHSLPPHEPPSQAGRPGRELSAF